MSLVGHFTSVLVLWYLWFPVGTFGYREANHDL
jgi:hypothetical protein